jgi:hypothetical protein
MKYFTQKIKKCYIDYSCKSMIPHDYPLLLLGDLCDQLVIDVIKKKTQYVIMLLKYPPN